MWQYVSFEDWFTKNTDDVIRDVVWEYIVENMAQCEEYMAKYPYLRLLD